MKNRERSSVLTNAQTVNLDFDLYDYATNLALSGTALRTAAGPWYVWLQIDWRNFKVIDSFDVEDKSKT
jgi:hypothetical protein